jgi:MoaA/NifB/PqqE/SkfB family radical SAM enzyme
VFNIIDQLDAANVASVVFTGGDIFTRKDAYNIIEHAVEETC